MGQSKSTCYKDLIPDVVQVQLMKHSKIFSELGNLDYEEFQRCLHELNELSRKCIDSSGKQMVFAVKKGTDTTFLWKASVRIACVKVDPTTKKIEDYKLIQLKQFLQVFNNFQTHINAMAVSEDKQQRSNNNSPTASAGRHHRLDASYLMNQIHSSEKIFNFDDCDIDLGDGASSTVEEPFSECCICLDRPPDLILGCTHAYCTPCLTQWNLSNKSCPICLEAVNDTNEGWVISEMPDAQEVNEEICAILTSLSKSDK